MSYDLAVFEADGVPRDDDGFQAWFFARREAAEESETSLPHPATQRFAGFYAEMVHSYPDMNGLSGKGIEDDENLTGYEFQPDHIYMDFRWSVAEAAASSVMGLAQKHGLGLYDLNDVVIFPEGDPHAGHAKPAAPSLVTRFRGLFGR